MKTYLLLPLLGLLLLAACAMSSAAAPPNGRQSWQGRVVKVFDGDSMIIHRRGQRVEVRLFGVDSPERGQPWAGRARRFTSKLMGRTVTITPVTVDKFGRVVGRLTDPGQGDHGLRLIQHGLAWWFKRYAPENTAYRDAQRAARAARRGLWREPNPIPPWEWRRQSKPNR